MRCDGPAEVSGGPAAAGDAAGLGSPAGFGGAAGFASGDGEGAVAGAAAGGAIGASSSDTIQPEAPLAGSRTLRQRRPPPSRSAPISSSSVPSPMVRTSAAVGEGSDRKLAPWPSVLTTVARSPEPFGATPGVRLGGGMRVGTAVGPAVAAAAGLGAGLARGTSGSGEENALGGGSRVG